MNCQKAQLQFDAALDEELFSSELAEFEEHLSGCEACREELAERKSIDRDLRQALQPPSAEFVIARVMKFIKNNRTDVDLSTLNADEGSLRRSVDRTMQKPVLRRRAAERRVAGGTMFLLVCTVAVAAIVIGQLPAPASGVAEITMATGPIEVQRQSSTKWTEVSSSSRFSLPAHSRVRTSSGSLCEVRTKSNALVRLNHETELVFHRSEEIELVTGEVWCRTPETTGLEVTGPNPSSLPSESPVFTCPSSSETQWQASPNQDFRCMAVSSSPVEVKVNLPQMSCTVEPGDSLTVQAGTLSAGAGHSDRVNAMTWQLPLLILRNPNDKELQQRLTQLLSTVGNSKMRYFYEDDIRQLGAPGTIPLLAFVGSAESMKQPELRHRAMNIIADLAEKPAIRQIETLLIDNDPVIRQLSQKALLRLDPHRNFDQP